MSSGQHQMGFTVAREAIDRGLRESSGILVLARTHGQPGQSQVGLGKRVGAAERIVEGGFCVVELILRFENLSEDQVSQW